MEIGYIKLASYLTKEDFVKISQLEKKCLAENVALKLELDYKMIIADEAKEKPHPFKPENINEFMYFLGEELVGYIGVCGFGGIGSQIEINGMVHPDFRRRGIFKALFDLVKQDFHKRSAKSLLLLSDRTSVEGQAFIKSTQAVYKHTEYEMYLDQEKFKALVQEGNFESIEKENLLSLRKATNADSREIERQNVVYFKEEFNIDIETHESDADKALSEGDSDLIKPEDEERRGMTIYIAYEGENIIGKTHLQLSEGIGGIYGLGIMPKYRGRGYGRWILMKSVASLLDLGAKQVMLQVEANNSNALNLYKSCGFNETSTMDYYKIEK